MGSEEMTIDHEEFYSSLGSNLAVSEKTPVSRSPASTLLSVNREISQSCTKQFKYAATKISDTNCRTQSVQELGPSASCCKKNGSVKQQTQKSKFSTTHCCDCKTIKGCAKKRLSSENQGPDFRCGGCERKFYTICCLHDHLKTFHHASGSYHYDDIIRTAFPKYESFCRFTQTDNDAFFRDADCELETYDLTSTEDNINKRQDGTPECSEDLSSDCKMDCDDVDILPESLDLLDTSSSDFPGEATSDISEERTVGKTKKKQKTDSGVKRKKKKAQKNKKVSIDEQNDSGISCETVGNVSKGEKTGIAQSQTDDQILSTVPNNLLEKSPITDGNNSNGSSLSSAFVCDLCNISFKSNSNLVRHETVKHPENLKFSCSDCERKFVREIDLSRHRTYAHSQVKLEKEVLVGLKSTENGIKSESQPCKQEVKEEKGEESPVTDKCESPTSKRSPKKTRSKEEIMLLKSPCTCELCGYIMPRSKMEIHRRIHTGSIKTLAH